MISLIFKSLRHRWVTALACVLSIALSTGLFLGIEQVRKSARESFTDAVSKADLLIGARGGSLPLLLYTIFHLGQPINNIKYETFEELSKHSAISWAIPYSLGDSYKGHRVVGTNQSLFEHYQFRGDQKIQLKEGRIFQRPDEVVIGSVVAKNQKLKVGDPIVLTHGVSSEGIFNHEATPFKVVGILKATSTPIDKALFVQLEGIELLHVGWEGGVPPSEEIKLTEEQMNNLKPESITSFLLGLKSRMMVLRFRSVIDQYEKEPLTAIIPALGLQELWNTLGYVENALSLISLCVLAVGLIGIFIALYTSLQERRREIALFRAVGAGTRHIFTMLLGESFILVFSGLILGLLVNVLGLYLLNNWFMEEFSLFLDFKGLDQSEYIFIGVTLVASLLAGLIPAIKAYRQSLQDGLTVL
ncbi:MAG: ABC transporter permease [Bacteriovoracaceae bacterium]